MQASERRRVVVAAAFTLVALPAIWLLDRDDPDAASTTVAAAGVPSPGLEAAAPDSVAATEATEPEVPVFLDNTVVVVRPAVVDVARPESTSAQQATGEATYKRYVGAPVSRPCTTALVRAGTTITVTNVDNGLSTTCTNTLGTAIPVGADIAIDTDVFVTIADLTDAPIFVRLSW